MILQSEQKASLAAQALQHALNEGLYNTTSYALKKASPKQTQL